MNKALLLEKLEQLRQELGASPVSPELHAQFNTLISDIETSLEEGTSISASQSENLKADVQDLVLQFETDHPQLTGLLNQVASALANLGI